MKNLHKLRTFFPLIALAILVGGMLNLGISKASAHGKGPPFVKLNGEYLTTNPIVNAMGLGFAPSGSIIMGSDSTSSAFLVNQQLTFEIDEQFFPNPYQQFNPFGQQKDQQPMQVVYQWSFADGSQPVEGQTVTHAYGKQGTYIIDLKVKYPEKNPEFISVNTVQLDIVSTSDYKRPIAKMQINNKFIEDPMRDTVEIQPAKPVAFDGSTSVGKIVKYQWDFGDEKSSDKKIVKHRYSRDSYFPVPVLRVTDENGLVNDTYVMVNLPFGGVNPIQKIWYTIYDFVTGLFFRE